MTEGWKIVIVSVLLIAGIASHYYFEKRAVAKAVIVTQTRIETEYKSKLIAAQQLAAQQSAALTAYKVKADKEKQDAVQAVDAKYTDLVRSLQQRPTRADLTSSVATAVASARKACTGAQLFREDGEFLAGEAARADKVVIERDYYYGRYEDARKLLAGEGKAVGFNGATTDAKPLP